MTAVFPSDTVYATVSLRGIEVARFQMNGMTCLTDILRRITSALAGKLGLATVDLRNANQGWQQRRLMKLAPAA